MKKAIASLLLVLSTLPFAKAVLAHCPLCVAGAGAGLSLSRVLGIDDSITGVWLAAFLGATSFWINNSIKRKVIPFQEPLIYLVILVTTTISFYKFGLINEHNGLIFSLPKLTFGILVGGTVFYAVDKLNSLIRKARGSLFPYQSIVFSLGAMLLLSVAIYFLINFFI